MYIDTSNRNRVKQQQEEHELSDASDVEGDDEELVFMSMLYDRGALGVAIYNALTTSLKMLQLQIHDAQELEQVTSASCVAVSLRETQRLSGLKRRVLLDSGPAPHTVCSAPCAGFVSEREFERDAPYDQEPRRETPDKDRDQHPKGEV